MIEKINFFINKNLKRSIICLCSFLFLFNANAKDDTQELIESLLPKVVVINTENTSGTGMVISKDGYILSVAHLFNNQNSNIEVRFFDDRTFSASLIGTDDINDIAILKINADNNFSYIDFEKKAEYSIGENVIIIGNPQNFGISVTRGIISGLNRDLKIGNFDNYIQIDTQITKGSSGSPLFNKNGDFIGLLNMKFNSNIAFAIPNKNLPPIINELKTFGNIKYGYLGIKTQRISNKVLKSLNISNGVVIVKIDKKSNADKAGLLVSDILISYNDLKINEPQELNKMVNSTEIGTDVEIKVLRDDKIKTFTIKITENQYSQEFQNLLKQTENIFGAYLLPINNNTKKILNIKNEQNGLYVLDVKLGSKADISGFRKNDIITHLNQKSITMSLLLKTLDNNDNSNLIFIINRNNENRVIILPIIDE
ncbi:MAG: hypothetical protein Ta2D_07910 [Rickettsiales bacterium]|nr:MAG: hypothetical protein Ta2D_07910 [Rickettsiales bacterium]